MKISTEEEILYLEREIATLHSKDRQQPKSLELIRLQIKEFDLRIEEARQESKLSKEEAERLLLMQEKQIAAYKADVANYKRKCEKSLSVGQQMTSKLAKYEQLQLVIAKSIQEASKGIDKLKADNQALLEGLEQAKQQA